MRYEETIRQASRENGLEPAFVAGVIHTESRFRPDAESSQEAYGLMQMLPATAEFVQRRSGIEGDFRDPRTNIRLGTWYLGYLGERYNGDERLMLAAYNSGEGTVDGWISEEGFDIAKDIPSKRRGSTSSARSKPARGTRNSTDETCVVTPIRLGGALRPRRPVVGSA